METIQLCKETNFEKFHKGSFCYHWHGKWNEEINENSIMKKLINIIKKDLI